MRDGGLAVRRACWALVAVACLWGCGGTPRYLSSQGQDAGLEGDAEADAGHDEADASDAASDDVTLADVEDAGASGGILGHWAGPEQIGDCIHTFDWLSFEEGGRLVHTLDDQNYCGPQSVSLHEGRWAELEEGLELAWRFACGEGRECKHEERSWARVVVVDGREALAQRVLRQSSERSLAWEGQDEQADTSDGLRYGSRVRARVSVSGPADLREFGAPCQAELDLDVATFYGDEPEQRGRHTFAYECALEDLGGGRGVLRPAIAQGDLWRLRDELYREGQIAERFSGSVGQVFYERMLPSLLYDLDAPGFLFGSPRWTRALTPPPLP